VPGGSQYKNVSALSYHWYCFTLSVDGSLDVTLSETSCNPQGDLVFQAIINDITQTGGSSFLTEFGFDPTTENGQQQNEFVLLKADQYLQSWTVWHDLLDGNGQILYAAVSQYARPYAQAISGTPTLMYFAYNTTKCFTLMFTINKSITQPTEIYIGYYLHTSINPNANGYTVTLTPASSFTWNVDSINANLIDVYTTSIAVNGELGTVYICPQP